MPQMFKYLITAITLCVCLVGCASQQSGSRSSVVDYLYPNTADVHIVQSIPELTLPIRLGIAFVPSERSYQKGQHPFALSAQQGSLLDETAKLAMLESMAQHFKTQPYIGNIQIIPSNYLRPQGSFTNVDQLQALFGIDVIALISFDQMQFSHESTAALSYWTLIGAYFVSGQKNDTSTLMDTAVYDIKSRKLLFRAPGVSHIKGRSTPINLAEELRQDSHQGFHEASEHMISQLAQELDTFTTRLKTQPNDVKVVKSSQYRGAGSVNWSVIGCMLLIMVCRQSRSKTMK